MLLLTNTSKTKKTLTIVRILVGFQQISNYTLFRLNEHYPFSFLTFYKINNRGERKYQSGIAVLLHKIQETSGVNLERSRILIQNKNFFLLS